MKIWVGKRFFAAGVFPGEKWYSFGSWFAWPLIRRTNEWDKGFVFGPFLFYTDRYCSATSRSS